MAEAAKEKLGKGQSALLAAFLLGIFIGAMDTGIVSPARTVMESGLGITPDLSIWIITLYTLVYAVAMPISGRLSDVFGKKKIYLASITIFMVGSFLCGLSDYMRSFPLLLLFRGIQAIGGGGIMPIATAYIGERFPVSKRGMALGFVGAIYGIATLIGPTLGSAILSVAGDRNWGLLFFVNVPICIVAILIAAFVKTPETEVHKVKFDIPGSVFLAVVVASFMYALTNLNFTDIGKSFADFNVWFFLVLTVVFLPILIVWEKKNAEPVLRLKYFTDRDMALTLAIAFFVGCGMMGLVFIPQFAENTLRLKAGSGGYVVTLVAVFAGLAGPIGGKIIDRFSSRVLLITGFLTTIIASMLIAFVVVPMNQVPMLFVTCSLLGLGMGFTMGTPLNYLIQLFAPEKESGSAQSTLSLIRSVGVAVSPNLLIGFITTAAAKLPRALSSVVPPPFPGAEGMPMGAGAGSMAADPRVMEAFSEANVTTIVETIRRFSDTVIERAASRLPAIPGMDSADVARAAQAEYARSLAEAAPRIEETFQRTLNSGFAELFIAIGCFALAGLILTFFLTGKELELKKAAKEKEGQTAKPPKHSRHARSGDPGK